MIKSSTVLLFLKQNIAKTNNTYTKWEKWVRLIAIIVEMRNSNRSVCSVKPKERRHLDELGVPADERMILKWILKQQR